MLRFTGHPLVDVGVAVITLFSQRQHPTEVTAADLERMAEYIATDYTRQPLKSFLTVAFPNSGFTQPAFEKTPERRLVYANLVARAYLNAQPAGAETCVFTGEPATAIAFGETLSPGRAFRQHIPLLTGEDVINFHPGGDAGVPVSGWALLAIQAFPLGCAKSGGKLLAVHSDSEEIILYFAGRFLEANRQAIQLAQQANDTKLPEASQSQRTLLVHTLVQAALMQHDALTNKRPFSITAYHLTNSGQGVALDLYHLPLQIVGFLRVMLQAEYQYEWDAIVRRAWDLPPPVKGDKAARATVEFKPRRNHLYEDLFRLPGNAPTFIRTYFLRVALNAVRSVPTDPRGAYSVRDQAALVSWKITERFLKGVLQMDKQRINEIRQLGDRLAAYVSQENDRRFFSDFFTLQNYDHLRNALIKANVRHVKRGQPPLIMLDPYLIVFEEGDEVARSDWRLARDLVLIRMIEQLHESGWLHKNVDIIPETTDKSEEAKPEEA